MKLNWLEIKSFKHLQDFKIDFDQNSLTTVLIGKNGTGKSNLLEALVVLFRDLHLDDSPTFAYKIGYLCRGRNIKIDADPFRQSSKLKLSIDDKDISLKTFRKNKTEYLPSHVFGYYSGLSKRMEAYFDKPQEDFYKELLNGNEQILRPLFYARLVHSQFVLLSFFLEDDQKAENFLRKILKIQKFDSVLFVMKKPPWKSPKGDPRFWNARGVVQKFLDVLYNFSLAPLRIADRLYLFISDVDKLKELANYYNSQSDFFKVLESTYISSLIEEVRIRVVVSTDSQNNILKFRELSEGEQQLLTVLGLLRFTKQDESLFLLDEPDTHLNPEWSIKYLEILNEVVGEQNSSHIIMSTHSPITLGSLLKEQVKIMRCDDSGKIYAESPDEDPRGMGFAGILTSEMFGFRSILDLETLKLLDEKRRIASKDELSKEDKQALAELNEKLQGVDFADSIRDPLYKTFVKAISLNEEYQSLEKPNLTKEEQTHLKEISRDTLNAVINKKEDLQD